MRARVFISAFLLVLFFTARIFSQPLEIPAITNVSVDKNTQKVLISWSMNNPALVDGYIVLRQIFGQSGVVDGTFNVIATINNQNQFSYLDVGPDFGFANPDLNKENYRLASFKNVAGVIEYSTLSNHVSSIFLSTVNFELCLEQNELIWTSYHGFGTSISGYRVYYSDAHLGIPVLLSDQAPADTNFIHQQVASNVSYFYYIEAYSNTIAGISASNIQEVLTTMPPVPLIMDANFGTVELYNHVALSFTVDGNAGINNYLLLKSTEKDGFYDTIASFPRGTANIVYSDFVKTNQEVAYYKVVAINTCGLKSRETDIAHNILLEATPNAQQTHSNSLKWNLYEGWSGSNISYVLYRSADNGVFEEIATLGNNENSYVDDITRWILPEINGLASKGHFCYYVVANNSLTGTAGNLEQSKSNISCAHQETIAFIPNAFNPNSNTEENRTFKPVISFVNDYKLIIYNRSGEIIFQSVDPLVGWDGRYKGGNLLKKGTYVYYLKYRTKDNKLIEKSGQINLVY